MSEQDRVSLRKPVRYSVHDIVIYSSKFAHSLSLEQGDLCVILQKEKEDCYGHSVLLLYNLTNGEVAYAYSAFVQMIFQFAAQAQR